MKSDDTTKPAFVIEKDGVTKHYLPCAWRKGGICVVEMAGPGLVAGPAWAARRENDWETDEYWSVTHEPTGAGICIWERREEAIVAAQVLLSLKIDWTQEMKPIQDAVASNPVFRAVISALKQGQLIVLPGEVEGLTKGPEVH